MYTRLTASSYLYKQVYPSFRSSVNRSFFYASVNIIINYHKRCLSPCRRKVIRCWWGCQTGVGRSRVGAGQEWAMTRIRARQKQKQGRSKAGAGTATYRAEFLLSLSVPPQKKSNLHIVVSDKKNLLLCVYWIGQKKRICKTYIQIWNLQFEMRKKFDCNETYNFQRWIW